MTPNTLNSQSVTCYDFTNHIKVYYIAQQHRVNGKLFSKYLPGDSVISTESLRLKVLFGPLLSL